MVEVRAVPGVVHDQQKLGDTCERHLDGPGRLTAPPPRSSRIPPPWASIGWPSVSSQGSPGVNVQLPGAFGS